MASTNLIPVSERWDVVVVGAGPAGLSAAYEAARRGARTLVLERAEHPRYKTCGGGLIGPSIAAAGGWIDIPVADRVNRLTFTHDGRREFSRSTAGPVLTMVRRTEFDDALRKAAVEAGAEVRQHALVRSLSSIQAGVIVGADGSAGITARHVGVRFDQVDLGLELELPVPSSVRERWRGRVLIDWGPLPGSYALDLSEGRHADRRGHRGPRARLRDAGLPEGVRRALRAGRDRARARLRPSHAVPARRLAAASRQRDRGRRRGRSARAVDPRGDQLRAAVRRPRRGGRGHRRSGRLRTIGRGDPDAGDAGRAATPAGLLRLSRAFSPVLGTPLGWRVFRRFCTGETSLDQEVSKFPIGATLNVMTRTRRASKVLKL